MKSMFMRTHQAGSPTFAIPFADSVYTRVLAGAAETITVPASARFAVFSATDDVWVSNGGTAAVPVADSDSALTELNPAVRAVEEGDILSLIGTCTVTVSFYS